MTADERVHVTDTRADRNRAERWPRFSRESEGGDRRSALKAGEFRDASPAPVS